MGPLHVAAGLRVKQVRHAKVGNVQQWSRSSSTIAAAARAAHIVRVADILQPAPGATSRFSGLMSR